MREMLPAGFDPLDYHLAAHDPATGGYVVVHRRHGADELTQNLAVAVLLMRRGERVVLLAVEPGQRTPDATRNEEAWEFKRLGRARNIPRAIEKSLLQRKGQASRFVLHIQQPYSLAQVAILFPDDRLATLRRADIAARNFVDLKK